MLYYMLINQEEASACDTANRAPAPLGILEDFWDAVMVGMSWMSMKTIDGGSPVDQPKPLSTPAATVSYEAEK